MCNVVKYIVISKTNNFHIFQCTMIRRDYLRKSKNVKKKKYTFTYCTYMFTYCFVYVLRSAI